MNFRKLGALIGLSALAISSLGDQAYATRRFLTLKKLEASKAALAEVNDWPKDEDGRVQGWISMEECKKAWEFLLENGEFDQEDYDFFQETKLMPNITRAGKYGGISGVCGCFHPATQLLTFNLGKESYESLSAEQLAQSRQTHLLAHLTEDSKIEAFDISAKPISRVSRGPEELPLVVIGTATGKVLKLTTQHAVMTLDGTMVKAETLKAGDFLRNEEGYPVEISTIASEGFSGDVINFLVASKDSNQKEHVIFAEGIAVGDLAWQNSLVDELEKVMIRK